MNKATQWAQLMVERQRTLDAFHETHRAPQKMEVDFPITSTYSRGDQLHAEVLLERDAHDRPTGNAECQLLLGGVYSRLTRAEAVLVGRWLVDTFDEDPTEKIREADAQLHKLWTAAVGQPGYSKGEWQHLLNLLWALVRIPRPEAAAQVGGKPEPGKAPMARSE
jgi:hypothetical protein